MPALKTILILLAGSYVLLAALVYVVQRRMMYFPTHFDVPPRGVPPFEPWTSPSGEHLGYVRAGADTRRVVVFFHGNGGEAIHRAWLADLVPAPDLALVLAEYPGYGARAGTPTEATLVAAGRDVVAAARERFGAPITVFGESLGSGVAAAVADLPGVDRLALLSPFQSALDVGRRRMPFLPVSLLMRDPFRSDRRLASLAIPLHVIHGTADDIVPFDSGRALFDAYPGPKEHTAIAGARHNDVLHHLLEAPEAAGFRGFIRDEPSPRPER